MRAVGAILAMVSLVACSQPPDIEEPVTTSSRAPIALAVNELRIDNRSEPPADATFKDRRASESLVNATESFLANRLLADGGNGWLQADITDAAIIERPRQTTPGIRGALVEEADAELVADLTVRLGIFGADGLEQNAVDVKVGRTRQLSERLDVLQKTAEAESLVTDLLRQLDDQLTQAVDSYLAEFKTF